MKSKQNTWGQIPYKSCSKNQRISRLEAHRHLHYEDIRRLTKRIEDIEEHQRDFNNRGSREESDATHHERITIGEAIRRSHAHADRVDARLLREAARDAAEADTEEDATMRMMAALESVLGYPVRWPDKTNDTRNRWRWEGDDDAALAFIFSDGSLKLTKDSMDYHLSVPKQPVEYAGLFRPLLATHPIDNSEASPRQDWRDSMDLAGYADPSATAKISEVRVAGTPEAQSIEPNEDGIGGPMVVDAAPDYPSRVKDDESEEPVRCRHQSLCRCCGETWRDCWCLSLLSHPGQFICADCSSLNSDEKPSSPGPQVVWSAEVTEIEPDRIVCVDQSVLITYDSMFETGRRYRVTVMEEAE